MFAFEIEVLVSLKFADESMRLLPGVLSLDIMGHASDLLITLKHLIQAWIRAIYRCVGDYLSSSVQYYDAVVQFEPREEDTLALFNATRSPAKETTLSFERVKDVCTRPNSRVGILLNGNFNHSYDIQRLLEDLKPYISRTTRLFVVAYNPYFSGIFSLLTRFGVRHGEVPKTFVTKTDLTNLVRLSGFDVIQIRRCGLVPFRWMGIGTILDRLLTALPLIGAIAPLNVITLRPELAEQTRPSLSILIPARNEKGNIENAMKRMPDLGAPLEVIFVEGHSNDGTWEEIQRIIPLYTSEKIQISAYQQTGKGKNDAVRWGFSKAKGDLLTILDADLTMPPELLGRFYDAYCEGRADFINGSRLVYPMEGEAMRFLNHLGNIFFAKTLSFVLQNRIGDSLCGTKLLARHDYERFVRWRNDFGDFDPFGDFELLFPASVLHLGIVDIPVRYRARTYGTTNIRRFRDGWLLLKMTLRGLVDLRLGAFHGSQRA
jgi:hypothetical protein